MLLQGNRYDISALYGYFNSNISVVALAGSLINAVFIIALNLRSCSCLAAVRGNLSLSMTAVSFYISLCTGTCNTAKYNDISYCISAQTVCTVYAASNLTSCEQTRNCASICLQNLTCCVNLNTAHGVVNSRCTQSCIILRLIQRQFHALTAKLVILACCLISGISLQSLCQSCAIYANLLAQCFRSICLCYNALLNIRLNRCQTLSYCLIKYQVALTVCLLQNCCRYYITSLQLVYKTLSFFINQNRTVSAHTLSIHGLGLRIYSRMGLNLLHIYELCAQLLCHSNAVAGCTCMVGGTKASQIRLVLFYHLCIRTKAAGCQNNCGTVNGHFLAVFICSNNAAYSTFVIYQNLLCSSFQKNRNVQFCHLIVQSLYQHRSYCRSIGRTMNTLYACSAEHAYNA